MPSVPETNAKKAGDLIFFYQESLFPTWASTSHPRQEPPSTSWWQHNQGLPLLIQVGKAEQPYKVYIQGSCKNVSRNAFLFVRQLLYEQFAPRGVLHHACIPLMIVLHFRYLLDHQITEISSNSRLPRILLAGIVTQRAVQCCQGAMDAFLDSPIASTCWQGQKIASGRQMTPEWCKPFHICPNCPKMKTECPGFLRKSGPHFQEYPALFDWSIPRLQFVQHNAIYLLIF